MRKKLNKEELALGCIYFISWFMVLRQYILFAIPGAYFWAKTGRGDGAFWRKIFDPIIMAVIVSISLNSLWHLICASGIIVLYQGYGIPTLAPGRPDNDEGSAIGRIAFSISNGNVWMANLIARFIYFSLLSLSLISIAFVNFKWWILSSIIMIVSALLCIIFIEGEI